jgi:uncharacterized protein
MTRFQPTFYASSLTKVTPAFFKKHGYVYLCCDLDNTLAPYDELTPRPEMIRWLETLKQSGLSVLIISNNDAKRVQPYADAVGLPWLAKTGKPFRNKLLKFLQQKGYAKEKVILIGDQLLTDVWLANRLGIHSLFVERLVNYDHWPTWLNRLIEKRLKARLNRMKALKHWEETTE